MKKIDVNMGEVTGMLYDEVLQYNGIALQTVVLCEELSEVMKAASKLLRHGGNDREDLKESLAEEIADAEIMMEQMSRYYGINRETIENFKLSKKCRMKTFLDNMKEQMKTGDY